MYISEDNKVKLAEQLNKEISKILEHGELSKDTLHSIYEMIDVFKDMCEIDEKDMSGGYSQRSGGYSQRMMPYGDSYNSYDRRGGGYSRNSYNSYGSERDRMMDEFMSQASSEKERDLIRRIMNSI